MTLKSRRDFLKIGATTSSGFFLFPKNHLIKSSYPKIVSPEGPHGGPDNELLSLSDRLLRKWGNGLLRLQINRPNEENLHGGILCPACATIHGRCGDSIFHLLYLASQTGDARYHDAAMHIYDWMERNVSMPDGSWVNEVSVSDWKGTTVFGAAMLAESLSHFGTLLDQKTQLLWETRLKAAGDYLYSNFTIQTGNINYPITAAYTLSLLGRLLDNPKYLKRGGDLAKECIEYFSPSDRLIFGEGHPTPVISKKGCYSVDLGYNVEESLPALVLYTKLTGDKSMHEILMHSMQTHLEFMLPDGGWDNSWGTRNYKWTYWGSRTSDGCQTAYALMAGEAPVFYDAALRNTKMLDQCTENDLLYGGPHYVSHGIPPCVHHLFGHGKALAMMVMNKSQWLNTTLKPTDLLPREQEYGVKYFRDIDASLVSRHGWKATFTGYDVAYLMKSGHASGGALSLLWHEKTGPLITASMNRYQMEESFNMQRDKDPRSMCLTPRIELAIEGTVFTNINDFRSSVKATETKDKLMVITKSVLVDENQVPVASNSGHCEFSYQFNNNSLEIRTDVEFMGQKGSPILLFPVICSSLETIALHSDHMLTIQKPHGRLRIDSDHPFTILGTTDGRIFNFVPGMEAIVLKIMGGKAKLTLSVV